jgi:hypothetical protein
MRVLASRKITLTLTLSLYKGEGVIRVWVVPGIKKARTERAFFK